MTISPRLAVAAWRPTRGMFSPGNPTLDPRVFDQAGHMLPGVRERVLGALDGFWAPRYPRWRGWARVFLAGSAASFWWDDDIDMDVLIGIDLDALRADRPQNAGVAEDDIVAHLNHDLSTLLEPTTTDLGGFVTTFHVNPGSWDIRSLRPYAAYSITDDAWVVRPPVLPPDWGPGSFPDQWWREAEQIAFEAEVVLALDEPARTPAVVSLFDWLHRGRQVAYGPAGRGWLDWSNFVWQALSQHPDRLLARMYEVKHPELVRVARVAGRMAKVGSIDLPARLGGPASGRIPQRLRALVPPFGRDLREPRPVVLDEPARDDLAEAPPDVRNLAVRVLRHLMEGRAEVEAKVRDLAGAFTVRLAGSWRMALYLGAEQAWHVFWVGDHNYDEARRRLAARRQASGEVQHQSGTPLNYRGRFPGVPHRLYVTDSSSPPWGRSRGNFEGSPDDLVAFLDVFEYGKVIYIAFVTTRTGYEGRGLAQRLIDAAYERWPGKTIVWGELMTDSMEHLHEKYRQRHPGRTAVLGGSRAEGVTWEIAANVAEQVYYVAKRGDEIIGLLHPYDRTGVRAVWGGLAGVRFDVFDGEGRIVAMGVVGLANAKRALLSAL